MLLSTDMQYLESALEKIRRERCEHVYSGAVSNAWRELARSTDAADELLRATGDCASSFSSSSSDIASMSTNSFAILMAVKNVYLNHVLVNE